MPVIRKGWYAWLPWLAAAVLALAFAGFMRADVQLHQQVWQDRIALWTQRHNETVTNHSRDMTQQAMLLAQLIARDSDVLALVREAQQHFVAERGRLSAPLTSAARDKLRLKLDDYWLGMRDLGVPRLSIYVAPGAISFLRMHLPERAGDSVGAVRPMIQQTFSSGLPSWGLDIARSGSGPSAVLPIMANADQTGAVVAVLEVGMASLAQGSAISDIHIATFLQKNAVEQLLWDSARQNLHRTNPTTVEDWRLESTNDPLLHDWWNRGKIAINRQGQLLYHDQQVYLASWIPIMQVGVPLAESPMAALVWHDISADYSRYHATITRVIAKWSAALAVALLLLAGFIYLQRRYLQQVILDHREQLQAEHNQTEQARQRLALALRSSDSGFWEWDIVNDRARFSPEWRQLCGLGPESPNSLDLDEWMSRVHPADKRASYSDIIRHIKGETPMYENEYRLRIHDGSYKWILTRGKVVEWQANGRAALVLGVYSDITQRKNTELISIRQQAALHSLNEIASLSGVDPDAQLKRALSLGARYLGLSTGVISAIKEDSYRVRVAFCSQSQRDLVPLSNRLMDNYCSLTVAARDVVAEDDIPTSDQRQHPAYRLTQVESYIGAPLWMNGEVCGTLAFSSRKTRHHQYDALDKDFVRLLARWISSVVERWQQDIDKKVIIERFHKLSERLPGFLFQYQMRPDGSSFFPYASAGIKNIYNVEPEDVIESAECVFSVIHPDDVGWIGEAISLSASKLTPFVTTFRVNHPILGMIWAHFESLPEPLPDGGVLWNGYASDVTPLKETELKLKETNALRKAILDAANIAIISADSQGFIKTFNMGAELMLGYRADEIIDRQTPLLFHLESEIADYAQQLARELGYAVTPGFDTFIAKAREGTDDEREWLYVRKDGSRFPVLLTVSALRDSENSITGYMGIARDISEIKRIDQMKTEFISTVSHELRTPLTAISGALGIIANGMAGNLSEQAQRMIQIAYSNSHRLIYLVNDLLDMEKLVAGKMHFEMQPHSLRQLIMQSMEENTAFAEQYDVTYVLADDTDVQVVVDEQRLLQVLANYLSNAAKFSPANEVVSIKVELGFGRVRVSVSDKGPGVSEEFLPRLFQKFSQADSSDSRQKGGTGLGLAICKEIIERMGGSLGVEPSAAQGACFYFELPCEDATQKVPASRIEPVKNKPHLLIVEDDQATAEILSALLPGEHYDIDCAATGQAALELLQLRDYDLMTLDLNLPDMTGIDIVRYVRDTELKQAATGAPLPIIIVSGDLAPAKQALVQSGLLTDVYWQSKPLSYLEFDRLLNRVLTPAVDKTPEDSL
jgi:PAS domain S-box-containing protein